jgi:plastocyanin
VSVTEQEPAPSGTDAPPEGQRRTDLPPVLYPLLALLFGGALVWSYSRVLLAVSSQKVSLFGTHLDGKGVAAVIALLVPVNVLIGAALVAYGARVRRRPVSFPLLISAGLVVIGAGVAALNLTSTAAPAGPTGVTVSLVAQNTAFHPTTFTVPAGAHVTVNFDNRDAQTPHNFVLFGGPDATSPALFTGPIITGPATTQYPFTAPGPGTYFFHCEVHPQQMTGTVTVTAAGSTGGLALTAKNLAFSPTSLTAGAGGQITLHFVNDDPQTPHNFVLFPGTDASGAPLFTGPTVTGPGSTDYTFAAPGPGAHYFYCQFHPSTMHGTLTVP